MTRALAQLSTLPLAPLALFIVIVVVVTVAISQTQAAQPLCRRIEVVDRATVIATTVPINLTGSGHC